MLLLAWQLVKGGDRVAIVKMGGEGAQMFACIL